MTTTTAERSVNDLPAPQNLEETGLRLDLLVQLLVKALHFAGELSGIELAERVGVTFPVIDPSGSLNGIVASLNRILDITVPKDKQEGGTYVIPGHGRLTDEADVVEYRDMMTIIRDRLADAIKKGRTLEQVKAAGLLRDYEGRYGATQGAWTTDKFLEAAYCSLTQK